MTAIPPHTFKPEIVPVGKMHLEALRSGNSGWVCIRPVCDALGLDFSAQRRRLVRQPWATVAMMATVCADGSVRDMHCLDSSQVAQWLVTIDTSRIKDPAVKANLGELQIGAAAALDRWFRGTPAALPAPAPRLSGGDDPTSQLIASMRSQLQLAERFQRMEQESAQVAARQASQETRLALVEGVQRENAAAIVPVSPQQPELPAITKRRLIGEHVKRYAFALNKSVHESWQILYYHCDRRLGIAIGKYKLDHGESKLDRLERLGLLDKVGKVCDTDLQIPVERRQLLLSERVGHA